MRAPARPLLLLLLALPAAHALRTLLRRLRRPPTACDVIVKFGGSAVTCKATFETLAEESLRSAAAAVANGGARTILIHGAGSFGHFQAREHGVSKGTSNSAFSWKGFALTRASVCRLNGHVVSALLDAGVAAVGMPPFPTWVTCGKGLVPRASANAGIARIRELLDAGLTPVLHGDAVFDEAQGASILSGDTLMVLTAQALKPRLAVFLTDVAGVYDRPPTEEGATLLARIAVGADGTLLCATSTSTAAHDVTGGLAAKLDAAAAIAQVGVPVVIVQVGTVHADVALRGEVPAVCTLVEAAA